MFFSTFQATIFLTILFACLYITFQSLQPCNNNIQTTNYELLKKNPTEFFVLKHEMNQTVKKGQLQNKNNNQKNSTKIISMKNIPEQRGFCIAFKKLKQKQSNFFDCMNHLKSVLKMPNLKCPKSCISVSRFGGFNNNVIQLQNTIEHYINDDENSGDAYVSLILHDNMNDQFTSNFNLNILRQLCIFSQKYEKIKQYSCQKLDSNVAFYRKFQQEPRWKFFDRDLFMTWLIVNGISSKNRKEFEVQSKLMPKSYVAIHARFLEGECHERHRKMKISTKFCEFDSEYIQKKIHLLGAIGSNVVIFSDKQEENLVNQAVRFLNASLSLNKNIVLDMLLMIQADFFIGNRVSTVSYNIDKIRTVLYNSESNSLLL